MERRAALHEERRYDARVAQLVELHVANVVVAGSSPVSRSKDAEGREACPELDEGWLWTSRHAPSGDVLASDCGGFFLKSTVTLTALATYPSGPRERFAKP